MDAILDGVNNLTPEQRNAINRQIEADNRAAKAEAVEAAKLQFRAGVAGSRKPDLFVTGTSNIKTYLDTFEPFRGIMFLDGKQAINTFMTYMDSKAHNILISSGATETEDWEIFKQAVVTALSPPQASVQARFELKKANQRIEESVAEFGQRLISLGRSGYTDEELAARESALKDALSGGVRRDELAVHLINNSDKTFSELLAVATKMDAS